MEKLFWLRVADDGPGIEPGIRERIFEPFFTTRRQGFGLGMAVVHRIVDSLGGMVLVEDSPSGEGAAFLIGLPAASPGQENGKELSERTEDIQHTGTGNRC